MNKTFESFILLWSMIFFDFYIMGKTDFDNLWSLLLVPLHVTHARVAEKGTK